MSTHGKETLTVYEVVCGADLTFHYGQYPSYATIADAAPHVGGYDYLVAVENGYVRQLTAEEELEYQRARSENVRQSA